MVKRMVKMTGAEAIAKTLKEHRVEYVFYIPGIGVPISEIEAEDITVVLTRNEKCAAYIADGYSRISFKPGICYGYRGPGSMNLAAGLADAYWSSSPVIALTSPTQKPFLHKDTYQGLPDMAQFEEVTKWNIDVPTSDMVGEVLRNAFQVATSGCPGPVHVNFHFKAIFEEAETPELFADKPYRKIPAKRFRPDPDDTKLVAKTLTEAERPVIVAGQGVLLSKAWHEVIQLAETLHIPVATSNTGKGTIPDTHPLAVGVAGLYSKATANKVILDSDLVFFIGCKIGNMVTGNWTIPQPGTKVVQLDLDPESIGRNYKTEASMICDAKLGLRDLISTVKQVMTKPANARRVRLKAVEKIMKKWSEIAESEMNSDAIPVKGHRLVKEIREVLKPNDVLVADTSSETIWTSVFYKTLEPGRNYICASGSLGWSFPASIGAKLAAGNRRVLTLIGDGGLGYHIGEFETAVRYDIPFVTVVVNNLSWARPQESLKKPVNFHKVAEGFGGFGIRVERPGDIQGALQEAFDSSKPAIVDVLVDPKENGQVAMRTAWKWVKDAPTDISFM